MNLNATQTNMRKLKPEKYNGFLAHIGLGNNFKLATDIGDIAAILFPGLRLDYVNGPIIGHCMEVIGVDPVDCLQWQTGSMVRHKESGGNGQIRTLA